MGDEKCNHQETLLEGLPPGRRLAVMEWAKKQGKSRLKLTCQGCGLEETYPVPPSGQESGARAEVLSKAENGLDAQPVIVLTEKDRKALEFVRAQRGIVRRGEIAKAVGTESISETMRRLQRAGEVVQVGRGVYTAITKA